MMYDIDFFRETFDLKQRIVNDCFDPPKKNEVNRIFESNLCDKPLVFNVETTSHCNMRCVMCQRTTDFQRKPQHMERSTFENVVSQISPQAEGSLAKWRDFVEANLRKGSTCPSENNFYFDVVSRCVTLHNFGEPLLDPNLPDRVALMTSRNIPTYFSCNPCNIKMC